MLYQQWLLLLESSSFEILENARKIFSFFSWTIIYKIMKWMRKMLVLFCVHFYFWWRGSRKLFLISKRFFLSSKFRRKQKPRASEFVRIPESCRYCGQQRRTIKSFNRIFYFFLFVHSSKAKLNREIYARLRIAFCLHVSQRMHKKISSH